jgi:hypothetical protein
MKFRYQTYSVRPLAYKRNYMPQQLTLRTPHFSLTILLRIFVDAYALILYSIVDERGNSLHR